MVSKCSETHLQSVLHKSASASNTDVGDFEELKIIFRLIYLIYFLCMSILPPCMCAMCAVPMKALDFLELECWRAVSYHVAARSQVWIL